METLKLIFLALVQAFTEFLPVSSSGHLVLSKSLLGIESQGALLELLLHVGTLVSVCLYYRKRLGALLSGAFRGEKSAWVYALYVLLSMVPAGLVYVCAGDAINHLYEQPKVVSFLMIFNGAVLLSTGLFERRWRARMEAAGTQDAADPTQLPADKGGLSVLRVLAMGLGQAVAVLPGISRSGSSISAGRFVGLDSRAAAEFSFVMSIPVIAGGALLEFLDAWSASKETGEALLAGFSAGDALIGMVIAGVFGYLSLAVLIRLIGRGKFWVFGAYCLMLGLLASCLL